MFFLKTMYNHRDRRSPILTFQKFTKGIGAQILTGVTPFLKWIFSGMVMIVMCPLLSGIGFAAEPLLVGVKEAPPFVTINPQTQTPTGFSIDLMETIAKTLDPPRAIQYFITPDLPSHLQQIQSQEVELGIAATTVTSEREILFDFSHAFFQSSLAILSKHHSSWQGILNVIFSRDILIMLLTVIAYILVCANFIWFFERGNPLFNDKWLPGMMEGVWWTVVTMSTVGYGDFVPKHTSSRVLSVFVIFTGISLFGVAIAGLTSETTFSKLDADIQELSDLDRKQVGVISGTIGSQVELPIGAFKNAFGTLGQAIEALEADQIDAIVHDMPILQHYQNSVDTSFALTDKGFVSQPYGITFPEGSALREPINIALLKVMEGDPNRYQRLKEKWFGDD